jgi:hypothetical protein
METPTFFRFINGTVGALMAVLGVVNFLSFLGANPGQFVIAIGFGIFQV